MFTMANTISVGTYTVGFATSVSDLLQVFIIIIVTVTINMSSCHRTLCLDGTVLWTMDAARLAAGNIMLLLQSFLCS